MGQRTPAQQTVPEWVTPRTRPGRSVDRWRGAGAHAGWDPVTCLPLGMMPPATSLAESKRIVGRNQRHSLGYGTHRNHTGTWVGRRTLAHRVDQGGPRNACPAVASRGGHRNAGGQSLHGRATHAGQQVGPEWATTRMPSRLLPEHGWGDARRPTSWTGVGHATHAQQFVNGTWVG